MKEIPDKLTLKQKILMAAVEKHESVIHDFRQRIQEMISSEREEAGEEYDNHQQAFKMETMAEVNLLTDQLQFAVHEWEELMKIESYLDKVHDCVEFGSVVRTDRETFFVSASIERFHADGMPLFGLSVHSPLYKVMKGKRTGEQFTYNDTTYKILEIF